MAHYMFYVFTLTWISLILGSICFEDLDWTRNTKLNKERTHNQREELQTDITCLTCKNYDNYPYNRLLLLFSSLQDFSNNGAYVKRAPDGFMEMRGKKKLQMSDTGFNAIAYNPTTSLINNNLLNLFSNLNSKKNPSIPFHSSFIIPDAENDNTIVNNLRPMKDAVQEQFPIQEEYELGTQYRNVDLKRAPIGFTGMRGKRPADQVISAENNQIKNNLPFKQINSIENEINHEAFKRSTEEILESNNKKQRNIFRNKFVAVRGKKYFDEGAQDLHLNSIANYNSNLYDGQLSLYRGDSVNLPQTYFQEPYGKRTPSGFQGMRGKRLKSKGNQQL